MISVGSRGDRKGLSLRYLFEGEKMEFEAEFEEGEAYFQKNNSFGNENENYDDDDSTIDPDVSLSYIDEKIQDVLGHCQKDFEGGVSAGNLGPKFGGYGSFLPSYQRSPLCSHPKTPQKVLTYSAPGSPNNAHIEFDYQNSVSQSSASKPSRNRPTSFSAGSGPTRKGSTSNRKSKQESKSKSKSVNNFANDSDQHSLKVRIKVGTDNMLPKSKAEIYSGLGLDISPSSSLEVSPVNSSGFFHSDESPTSILEMMTSFPVSGSVLLSPLPYDVLHLTEKKLENNSYGSVHKGSQESTVTALHGSDLLKVDQNILGEKSKSKSTEKNSASMESTNGDDVRNTISVLSKKEMSVDNFAPAYKTSTSSGKRKSEGGLKNDYFTSKTKNNIHGTKSYNEDFKKNNGKVEETYKDFFGELDLDHGDHDEIGLEKPSEGINVKSTLENSGLSKGKLNRKKSQKPSSVYAKADSHVPITGNGVESGVVAPTVGPIVNEDWVCCDKCEKWRLLPPGVNPGSLPEKWLCSMLDWLPGMNQCNISEEETTKAITSCFPGPSIQGSQPVHPVGPELGVITLDVSYPDGTHQSSGVTKKHGLKDLPNEVKPSLSSNSLKKNVHTSYKTRSLNDEIQSPLVNEVEFQDSGQSRNVIVEKGRIKQKENNAYEGNNNRHSKIGIRRESTQDFTKDYKKVKIDKNDGKFDKRDVLKKRKKVNEIDDMGKYVKETSEASHRKEKKARVLKSFDEGKESKSKNIEDSTKGSSRRDMVFAATSSSSKISGARKMKNNNQEAKGSPVESVSSSPMRILNTKVVDFDHLLTKNVDTRSNEEKSKGGRNGSQGKFGKGSASKVTSLMKNVKIDPLSQDSKIPSKKDVHRKGKSNSLPPRSQNEIERKEKAGNNNNNMSSKALKLNKKVENQNGNQPINIKNPSPNGYKGKDLDPNVVLVRDLSNQATTNALREATNLKHMADRVKNTGSDLDSRALYMQAALKFLHLASLFESCHSQTGRYGDMIQSVSIYSSTVKLCEFCAQEYERTKEMTTAALAYKCMEVACLKVIYSSHATNCKDVNELQTSLHINPTGESPSSASASDLDNLNNAAAVDKAALAKGVNNTSQVAGHHLIAAKNKPNFTRILNLAQEVNSAMDASRKSRICFAAASSSKQEVGLSEVKKALDFNFHNVEGFLHLVRVAMEVI